MLDILTSVYKYIDDFSIEKDVTYQRIINKLSEFFNNMSSKEDKELLVKMVKEVYFEYNKSIKSKADSDTELMISTIMALLVEQNKEIKSIKKQ